MVYCMVLEQDETSVIYPYNAYTRSFGRLKNSVKPTSSVIVTGKVSSLMPTGLSDCRRAQLSDIGWPRLKS
jgi:hypothetical protein